MYKKKTRCIIGVTDEGQPIVTADYQCSGFTPQGDLPVNGKECQYCKYADFRKSSELLLSQSICRRPQNRVVVIESRKNEQGQQPSHLSEMFISNIKGGVITCVFDSEKKASKAVYINAEWTAITGYTMEELERDMNGNPMALVHPEDQVTSYLEYSKQTQEKEEYALTYRVAHKNGTTIWVIDRGVVCTLPNGDIQNQSIITEITEIKEQEEHLRRLAQLDQLTNLYNKVTFAQQAHMILGRQCDKLHAMMVLDIDNFKNINDSMGHAYGDKVLESVADYLRGLFRNRDLLGRIGGDEFTILMTDIQDQRFAVQRASELCAAMGGIKIGGTQGIPITVSLGIAIYVGGSDYDELFKQADAALYKAKSNGKNQICLI